MIKKIIIFLVMIISSNITAQNSISLKKFIGNKSHVIDATKDGFVEVRQYYVLKGSTEEIYGKNGNSYYGYSSRLGFLINDSLYVKNDIEPWKNDELFPKDFDSLKPQVSEIAYKSFNDTLGEYLAIDCKSKIASNSFDLYSLDSIETLSIASDNLNNAKIEFVYTISKNSNSKLEYRRENISDVYNYEDNSIIMDNVNENFIGGAFFMPFISLGKIEYKIIAIAYNNEDVIEVIKLVNSDKVNIKRIKGITPIKK